MRFPLTRGLKSLLLVLAGLLATAASSTPDKELEIWPDQLASSNLTQPARQTPQFVSSSVSPGTPPPPFPNVNFHAIVDLRRGREIQGVSYFHSGFGTGAFTVVSLLRVKMGQHAEVLAAASSGLITGPADIVPVELSILSSNLVIEEGYRYYVTVNVDNSNAAVFGVKVFYR